MKILIKYNKPNLRGIGKIKLKPGINEVEKTEWDNALKVFGANLQRLVDDDVIEVIENESGQPIRAEDILKMKDKNAIRLIKETYDEALLLDWHGKEKRATVLKAIEIQLETLAKAGEPSDKKGE